MIPSECLCRTLYFEAGNSCGTCFSYEKNNKQFLITARHIFEECGFPNFMQVSFCLGDMNLVKVNVNVYYHKNQFVDIAIMEPENNAFLTKTFNAPNYTTKGLIWGQDVFFLGFPYGKYLNIAKPNNENPIPFIKKACMSGMLKENEVNHLLLDGINNEGFSGGPVCFKFCNTTEFYIAGVISGYEYTYNYLETIDSECKYDSYIKTNTGIIFATDISHALEIIEQIK